MASKTHSCSAGISLPALQGVFTVQLGRQCHSSICPQPVVLMKRLHHAHILRQMQSRSLAFSHKFSTLSVGTKRRSSIEQVRWLSTSSRKHNNGGKSTSSQHEDQRSSTDPASSRPRPTLTKRLRKLATQTAITPHENIYNFPNALTLSRFLAAPLIGYLVVHGGADAWALGLFVYAGLTDLADGWIVRRYGLQTVVGTIIDPMADKTLMTVLTVALAMKGTMPLYLATLILGRDGLLGLAAIYYRYISLPPPKTLARYWDFSLPSAEVHPTGISKVNTALQLGLIGATMSMPLLDLGIWASQALTALQYTVATTTVWSGLSYVYSKDAVKILRSEDKMTDESRASDEKDERKSK